ncbi:ribosome small subunit-dependent GTPase A [Sporohalobacter salinus]|uniref:ribosome small subunit-dependent GTPase A n=1 Tax=Sporohalobacter salinus TaxID=1494606 RepID=UPI001961AD23|nr:ribosome small subunit-dependent GTPase A [Sporohalobacter salinus]MBM7623314.1 ribosome biogenesis GTPase [Sporohalobacter salinus]
MEKGRIIKAYAGYYYVLSFENNKIYETKLRGRFRQEDFDFYVGDKVKFSVIDEKEETGVIEGLLPRATKLDRPAVANVDQVVLVFASQQPELNYRLLDRFLLLVEAYEFEVLICLNKMDLVGLEKAKELMANYVDIGYRVVYTSAENNQGLSELKKELQNRLSVLAGPSGVGKSSLLNQLSPEAEMAVDEVSQKIKRGKHTTRHVELITLDNSGLVVDTPGFTSLNIDFITKRELVYFFREMKEYISKCKFNDCLHFHEPKCRIKQAVQEGEIAQSRYDSYLNFLSEIEGEDDQW